MPIHSRDYPPSSVDATETADANPGEPRNMGISPALRAVLDAIEALNGEDRAELLRSIRG